MAFQKTEFIAKETVITAAFLNRLQDALIGAETAIDGKVSASELTEAVDTALTEAKESGAFDGADYVLTDDDKTEIANGVKASLTTESWTFTLEDGSTVTKAVYVG